MAPGKQCSPCFESERLTPRLDFNHPPPILFFPSVRIHDTYPHFFSSQPPFDPPDPFVFLSSPQVTSETSVETIIPWVQPLCLQPLPLPLRFPRIQSHFNGIPGQGHFFCALDPLSFFPAFGLFLFLGSMRSTPNQLSPLFQPLGRLPPLILQNLVRSLPLTFYRSSIFFPVTRGFFTLPCVFSSIPSPYLVP